MGWMAPLRHLGARLLVGRISSNREPSMGEITTIGLDLAKHVFQVHGVDADGATVLRKQLRRGQVPLCAYRTHGQAKYGGGSVRRKMRVTAASAAIGEAAFKLPTILP